MDDRVNSDNVPVISDEYIEKHWRELIVTSNMSDDFEKSELLQEQRLAFLSEKYQ